MLHTQETGENHTGSDSALKNTVGLQPAAHFDSRLATFQLSRYGIIQRDALLAEIRAGHRLPEGLTKAELEADGYEFVGRLASKFDEHMHDGVGRKGMCSASLAFEELAKRGILARLDPLEVEGLGKLVDYTQRTDTMAISRPFNLDSAIKRYQYRQYTPDDGVVVQFWMEEFFNSFLYRERMKQNPPDVYNPPDKRNNPDWKPTVRLFSKLAALWAIKRFFRGVPNPFASQALFDDALASLSTEKVGESGDCPFLYVVEKRGLTQNKALAQIIEFARSLRNGRRFMMDLASFVDDIAETSPQLLYELAGFVADMLDCYYQDKLDWQVTLPSIYKESTRSVLEGDDRTYNLMIIETDSHLAWPYARSRKDGPDIMLQIKSSGNMILWTNGERTASGDLLRIIPMESFVGYLRFAEMAVAFFLRRERFEVFDLQKMKLVGSLTCDPYWFLFENYIFNGSHTAPDVPPTQLFAKLIADMARVVVSSELRRHYSARIGRILQFVEEVQADPERWNEWMECLKRRKQLKGAKFIRRSEIRLPHEVHVGPKHQFRMYVPGECFCSIENSVRVSVRRLVPKVTRVRKLTLKFPLSN